MIEKSALQKKLEDGIVKVYAAAKADGFDFDDMQEILHRVTMSPNATAMSGLLFELTKSLLDSWVEHREAIGKKGPVSELLKRADAVNALDANICAELILEGLTQMKKAPSWTKTLFKGRKR